MEQIRLWFSRSINKVAELGFSDWENANSMSAVNTMQNTVYDYNLIQCLRNCQYELLLLLVNLRTSLKQKNLSAVRQQCKLFLGIFRYYSSLEKTKLYTYLDRVLEPTTEASELVNKFSNVSHKAEINIDAIFDKWTTMSLADENMELMAQDIDALENRLLRTFSSQTKKLFPLYQSAPLCLD